MKLRRFTMTLASALALGACAHDLAHTNPLDPSTEVALHVVGPDTIWSVGDTVMLSLETDPQYEHATPTWSSDVSVTPLGVAGTFRWDTPFPTRTVHFKASLDTRSATKDVVFTQRPARVTVACAGASYRFATTNFAFAQFCPQVRDAHGYLLASQPAATITYRDTAVVRPANQDGTQGRIVANGSAWVVGSAVGLRDSVLVSVVQRFQSFSMAGCNSGFTILHVGDTLRLSIVRPAYDVGGGVMTVPDSMLALARATAEWHLFWPYGAVTSATVDQTGLITAIASGSSNFSATATYPMSPVYPYPANACSSIVVQ